MEFQKTIAESRKKKKAEENISKINSKAVLQKWKIEVFS